MDRKAGEKDIPVRVEGADGGLTGSSVFLAFDGVTYGIEVWKGEDGVTNLKFLSDPPPSGLDRVRYEWTGRLRRDPSTRRSFNHAESGPEVS